MFIPQRFEVAGEAFVEPQVRPVAAGDEVAEPLVGKLVSDQAVGAAIKPGVLIKQRCFAEGRRAGVLHATAEIVAADLGVLLPRVLHSKLVREEIEHRGGVSKRRLDFIGPIRRHVVRDRDPAPGLLGDVELADDERHQVNHVRLAELPVEPCPAIGRFRAALQRTVRQDFETLVNRRDDLRRLHFVRVIEARDPVAVLDGFTL